MFFYSIIKTHRSVQWVFGLLTALELKLVLSWGKRQMSSRVLDCLWWIPVGKASLSSYFHSVWFPAVYHLSARCTTPPNFSAYPETVLPMVGQRLLYEDAGGRWARITARQVFCPYLSTNSMICDEGWIKLPPRSTHQLPYSLPRLLN